MLLSQAIKQTFEGYMTLDSEIKKDFELCGIAPLESANETQISYIDQDKYSHKLADSRAGAVLLRKELLDCVPPHIQPLVVDNPHLAFALLSHLFARKGFSACENPSIDPLANIAPNVHLGKNVRIGARTILMPGVVIGDNVEIGEHCKIYPNVVIYRDTIIGNRVNIHAGCVIGCDGFGYAHTNDGRHIKIEHNGIVVIEDDVELGANNTIDRAVFGQTLIKKGVKIDNLVQIGHNCVVGEHSILVSQVGLAGSTTTGRNVVMGGQAGTGGHIHIGDFVQVAGRGAVGKNLPPHTKWGGHPLMELDEWMKFFVSLRRMVKKQNPK
ncbi:UDP-3-O-(3-hydroxymyristoyl)glucosamine N-acyltransferase [Helicobacter sp. MIT 05-5293]|uniref:UDP-3-O-acylglucosamine N-acyltransferase n=1 Tax=uncultured Helicobacter sp. TaxID=175537 RepID=A0A650F378_9HELI|nr:UDP-3-O-(3-hydroxymyristoyl)glucosamine N-acyltransferase [Helicobacter sp. MIT 05-5293]QGT50315.1 UDP-3-O-acylglucosamine N-acyltransferase [uncultured Helicobacter sp.]TLD79968.1 UDP-3-O-(3-hydroxymyristoyl)glucosamine N-acyltransferase [Helicobacter sp. MIT 05-5293]